jgi:hypothetical protein
VRVAENLKLRAEAQLEATERALASASSAEAKEQSEDARVKAANVSDRTFDAARDRQGRTATQT